MNICSYFSALINDVAGHYLLLLFETLKCYCFNSADSTFGAAGRLARAEHNLNRGHKTQKSKMQIKLAREVQHSALHFSKVKQDARKTLNQKL